MLKLIRFSGFGLGALIGVLGAAAPVLAGPYRVGLVLDKGGKDDKSFNAAAYQGAQEALKKQAFELKVVEAPDDNAFEPMLKSFAKKEFDLILGIGFAQIDAMKKVAAQFPERKFAIVDADISLPNVRALLFEEHEGSFVVGALAALASKSGKVGFVGGMDVPLIRRFEMGYVAGAKFVNPKIQTVSHFVGVTASAWNNPPKAKELALAQFSSGADVSFAAAGASSVGVFDAAEQAKKFAIGVDSNQNWIKPGRILTSMLKRVDLAVAQVIADGQAGKFTAGVQRMGLKSQGVDFALDQYNKSLLTPEMLKRAAEIKAQIISGKISVPDFYKKR